MMELIKTSETGWQVRLNALLDRSRNTPDEIEDAVKDIISRIKKEGDKALFELTNKYDRFDPASKGLFIDKSEIEKAASKIGSDIYEALELSAKRIEAFHSRQKEETWTYKDETGSVLGQKITPLAKVGVYIPGGRNAFPSTLLMNVIPAKIAGVKEIVVVSPTPDARVNETLLAAAHIAGVDKIYRIGGAQAVAALAFGTATVPKVDKVVGPGNAYVATAKRLLQGVIGIDSFAGPSEILVIADDKAWPQRVALDLMSQAEHDTRASALLATTSRALIGNVLEQIENELKTMPRKDVIVESMKNHGACILTASMEESLEVANMVAPEHLELMLENAWDYLDKVENAGAIFMGYDCPEAIGDYIAGPNHTLPTGSTARFYSPLGVYDFIKRSSIVGVSTKGVNELGKKASLIARIEELEAHARSVDCRIKG